MPQAFVNATDLDTLIVKLQEMRASHGNVPVCHYDEHTAADVDGVSLLVCQDNGGGRYISISFKVD